MQVDPIERQAILDALPEPARDPRFHGGVASMLLERAGGLRDVAVALGASTEVFLRPLPSCAPDAMELWVGLLERRRLQLAHDVSGPATGVLAALETVLEYEEVPESTRDILADARHGMLLLTRMLDGRSSVGEPNAVSGPLPQLLEQWARQSCEGIDPEGTLIDLGLEAPPDEVRLDASTAAGAIHTLTHNAWRNRRGQSVRVRLHAELEGEWLCLSLSDEGRGLTPESLRRAGELGFSTRSSSLGVGLFLLRWSLRRRGGAVVVQALEPGARVTVFLPANI